MKHSKKIVKDAALGEEPKVDSLRERVYQYLKDAMSAGKLRYGEFLDQDSICETLEVSKTPLRDALIRLEAEEVSRLIDIAESGSGLSRHASGYHEKTRVRDTAILTLFLGTGIRISELILSP